MRNCFWMVVGIGVPYVKHPTEEKARAEATRLALLHRGQEFTVLKSIATVSVECVQWSLHRTPEPGEISF